MDFLCLFECFLPFFLHFISFLQEYLLNEKFKAGFSVNSKNMKRRNLSIRFLDSLWLFIQIVYLYFLLSEACSLYKVLAFHTLQVFLTFLDNSFSTKPIDLFTPEYFSSALFISYQAGRINTEVEGDF